MTTEPDYDEFGHKYNHYKRLKLLKPILLLGSGLGFAAVRWTEASQALQFLWSCYVTKTHEQPYEVLYYHYGYAVIEMGGTLAQLLAIMAVAYFIYLAISFLWLEEETNELQLEYRRKEAERNYKQLKREENLLCSAQDILEQNMKMRAQLAPMNDDLSRLQDQITKMRLELSVSETKRRAKSVAKPALTPPPDLFELPPCPPEPANPSQPQAVGRKWRISKRRRSAPEF